MMSNIITRERRTIVNVPRRKYETYVSNQTYKCEGSIAVILTSKMEIYNARILVRTQHN